MQLLNGEHNMSTRHVAADENICPLLAPDYDHAGIGALQPWRPDTAGELC